MANVFPIISEHRLDNRPLERSEIIETIKHYDEIQREWIRRQVLKNHRVDILARHVLGYDVQPFHFSMIRFQAQHPQSLQLVFRGAGKSTICTISYAIQYLLEDPNIRLLIASKSSQNAEGFLKEIKGHFESNNKLLEIFGPYYDLRKVSKWDNKEIEVLPRTRNSKESSITCVGVDGTIVSKHYDVIFSDDLVDEENSRTEHMRNKTQTWYYKTLLPTLEPPSLEVRNRGKHHAVGTRYHFQDLYGHWIANEFADSHQIIRALDEKNRSPWAKKYPAKWFIEKRKTQGLIIFNSQYQCDTEAMKGEIFKYDNCQLIDESKLPKDLKIYMGVDLAIRQSESSDNFAIAVIGKDHVPNYYLLDFLEGHYRFNNQTKKIIEFNERWDPLIIAIENNAYQDSQCQNLRDQKIDGESIELPLKPVTTIKDKVTRAWRISPIFEDKRMFFVKTGKVHHAIERFVLFPNTKKDLFDAFDLAVTASKAKKRAKREEFGLI